RQSAATNWQRNDVGHAAGRHLVDDLQRHGRLPLDDRLVVEGRNHLPTRRLRELEGRAITIIEEITHESDLDEISAEQPRLVYLLLRRRHGHENNAALAEMAADIGKALGMVAGGGTDEKICARAHDQGLAEKIEGTPDLVGAHRRQVLALEEYMRTEFPRQVGIFLKRGLGKECAQLRCGCLYALGKSGHGGSRPREIPSLPDAISAPAQQSA